jgi:two-component system, OmpR family, response regulator
MPHTSFQKPKLRKVLIIEDEADMCLLLNILLDGKEMEIDHVKSLAKAQEYLSETSPDVVLLDNKLPDGFGVDFVQYIKKNYPLVKVVMISGFDPSASDVAIENGADKFLTKPFTRDQLLQSIKGVLN